METREPQHADPENWQDSRDIETEPGNWVPRYFRCASPRCLKLVTHGQVKLGGCECGGTKLLAAGKLEPDEVYALKAGNMPLTQAESDLIEPLKPCVVTEVIE